MSLKALTWSFDQDCGSPAQKIVLVALGDHANDAGIAWVGRATLVQKCSMSRSAVTRNLDALEEAGLIRRSRRERTNRSYTSSLVVLAPLHADRLPLVDATEDDLPVGVDQQTVDALLKLARGVVAEKAHLGAEKAQGGSGGGPQEPSKEPSVTENGADLSLIPDDQRPKKAAKHNGKKIPPSLVDKAIKIFEFTAGELGSRRRPLTATGDPSPDLKTIIGRMVEYPEVAEQELKGKIRVYIKQPPKWVETEKPNFGQIFGPRAFGHVLDTRVPDGGGKPKGPSIAEQIRASMEDS